MFEDHAASPDCPACPLGTVPCPCGGTVHSEPVEQRYNGGTRRYETLYTFRCDGCGSRELPVAAATQEQ